MIGRTDTFKKQILSKLTPLIYQSSKVKKPREGCKYLFYIMLFLQTLFPCFFELKLAKKYVRRNKLSQYFLYYAMTDLQLSYIKAYIPIKSFFVVQNFYINCFYRPKTHLFPSHASPSAYVFLLTNVKCVKRDGQNKGITSNTNSQLQYNYMLVLIPGLDKASDDVKKTRRETADIQIHTHTIRRATTLAE